MRKTGGRKEAEGMEKSKEKLENVLNQMKIKILWSSLQTEAWWTRVDEKREKERGRESSISRVTWKTNKAHAQDLHCSQRHRASSQGGLESPGETVSSAGFHAQKRMKTERRTRGTQVSSGARVFY